MQVVKIFCDHCGKEIDTMRDHDAVKIVVGLRRTDADLCTECSVKLWEMVSNFTLTHKVSHCDVTGVTEKMP